MTALRKVHHAETNPVIDSSTVVRHYLADRAPSCESSSLDWWKLNYHRFQLLANLAQKYLLSQLSLLLVSECSLVQV